MKNLITLILVLSSYFATAQINIARPYRTNGSVMVGDSALFIGQFKIPSFTTQSLNGYAAKAGQSFGLNLPDSTLSVYMGAGYTKFANKTYVVNGLNSKLSLAGGTMTGLLTGTTANFTTYGRFTQIGIGVVPLAGINIFNSGNLTGATSAYGYFSANSIQSGVTNAAMIFRSSPATAAAAFTLGTLAHFYADQGTFGAGSAVTTQYGYFVNSNLIGATNNYGFYGGIPAGTNRYNIFMNGTAQNYLNGNLGLGTFVPTAYLHIKGGTSSANTAPIKLTTGTNLATPENGAMEYDGTNLFFTPSATTRKTVAYTIDNKEVVLNKTANYTVLIADFANTGQITLYVDATSGNIDITIPSVATLLGYTLNVFKTDATGNTVTITGVSANINGASTKVLSTQYAFTEIHSNNTQYYAK